MCASCAIRVTSRVGFQPPRGTTPHATACLRQTLEFESMARSRTIYCPESKNQYDALLQDDVQLSSSRRSRRALESQISRVFTGCPRRRNVRGAVTHFRTHFVMLGSTESRSSDSHPRTHEFLPNCAARPGGKLNRIRSRIFCRFQLRFRRVHDSRLTHQVRPLVLISQFHRFSTASARSLHNSLRDFGNDSAHPRRTRTRWLEEFALSVEPLHPNWEYISPWLAHS